MAITTCGKCGNTSFEMVELNVQKARFKFQSVQCTSCGVPVGIMEYANIGESLTALEKALSQRLGTIESKVNRIN